MNPIAEALVVGLEAGSPAVHAALATATINAGVVGLDAHAIGSVLRRFVVRVSHPFYLARKNKVRDFSLTLFRSTVSDHRGYPKRSQYTLAGDCETLCP